MKKIFEIDDNILYHVKWEDRSSEQKYNHEIVLPKATYSPWGDDIEFEKIYSRVLDNTLVDKYRCFELWNISKQMRDKDGAVIEVGVWRGGTAAIIGSAIGNNCEIYLCDTFEGVVKATEKDSVYKGGEHNDTSIAVVEEILSKNNINNFTIVKGVFPNDCPVVMQDICYKLCHIDVDVYQSAKDVFEWVWPRLIKGGVVIFDDYGFAACEGVTTLVNELVESLSDCLLIHNLNGHGILVKN